MLLRHRVVPLDAKWERVRRASPFAALAGGHTLWDHGGRIVGTPFGSAAPDATEIGQGYGNTGASDGVYFPLSGDVRRRLEGTREATLVIVAAFTVLPDFALIIGIPWRNDSSWSSPFLAISFTTDGSGNLPGRYFYTDSSSSQRVSNSADGYWLTDGRVHVYAVSRQENTVEFYRDGVFFSSNTITDSQQNFNDDAPIHVFNRNHLTPGDGPTGQWLAAYISDRAWSLETHAQIARQWGLGPFLGSKSIFVPALSVGGAASVGLGTLALMGVGT